MRQRFRNKRRRVERQEEAKVRQAEYDALSLRDRLALTDLRPGESFRERDRLTELATRISEGESVPGVRLA